MPVNSICKSTFNLLIGHLASSCKRQQVNVTDVRPIDNGNVVRWGKPSGCWRDTSEWADDKPSPPTCTFVHLHTGVLAVCQRVQRGDKRVQQHHFLQSNKRSQPHAKR